MNSTNDHAPFFGPQFPTYPGLLEVLRVTGPADSCGIYPCFLEQSVHGGNTVTGSSSASLAGCPSFRDRVSAYIWEPNGSSLFAAGGKNYYLGRLVDSYNGLPLYATVCCGAGGSSSSSVVPPVSASSGSPSSQSSLSVSRSSASSKSQSAASAASAASTNAGSGTISAGSGSSNSYPYGFFVNGVGCCPGVPVPAILYCTFTGFVTGTVALIYDQIIHLQWAGNITLCGGANSLVHLLCDQISNQWSLTVQQSPSLNGGCGTPPTFASTVQCSPILITFNLTGSGAGPGGCCALQGITATVTQ